jgi:hypothetical protein
VRTCAQHGYGERCLWSRVEKVDSQRPVVYVADGSHASYFWANDAHPVYRSWDDPDPDAEDAADGGRAGFAPELITISDSTRWIQWPGHWGASGGHSPRGPAFQAKWGDPFDFQNRGRTCTLQSPRRSSHAGPQRSSTSAAAPKLTAKRIGDRVAITYEIDGSRSRPDPWLLVTTLDSRSDRFSPTSRRTVIAGKTRGHVSQTINLARGKLRVTASVRAQRSAKPSRRSASEVGGNGFKSGRATTSWYVLRTTDEDREWIVLLLMGALMGTFVGFLVGVWTSEDDDLFALDDGVWGAAIGGALGVGVGCFAGYAFGRARSGR